MLPSGQKLTLSRLVAITLEVVPFHVYAIFKSILEIMFCEGVENHLSLYQNGGIFNRGNRVKSQGTRSGKWGGWGMTVMLILVKNFLMKKEV
jgi:hypothetical protein